MEKTYTYIYVCSAYGGKEENYLKARTYARYVKAEGKIPIIPHTMWHGVFDDSDSDERKKAMEAGRELLKECSEVWVFGNNPSEGMRQEISEAEKFGIPVVYKTGSPMVPGEDDAKTVAVCKIFESTFGYFNSAIWQDVSGYVESGLSAELIEEAIQAAARKNAGWNYARAILNRCVRDGISTVSDLKGEGRAPKSEDNGASYDLEAFEKSLYMD